MKTIRVMSKYFLKILVVLFLLQTSIYSTTADWVRGRIIVSGQSSITTDSAGRPVDHETGAVISISEAGTRAFERAKDMAYSEAVSDRKSVV